MPLKLVHGKNEYNLDTYQRLRIGRSEQADIVVKGDPLVSSNHCVISAGVLVDANSTNGTFINSARISHNKKIPLHPGDVVTLGETKLFVVEVPLKPLMATRKMSDSDPARADEKEEEEESGGSSDEDNGSSSELAELDEGSSSSSSSSGVSVAIPESEADESEGVLGQLSPTRHERKKTAMRGSLPTSTTELSLATKLAAAAPAANGHSLTVTFSTSTSSSSSSASSSSSHDSEGSAPSMAITVEGIASHSASAASNSNSADSKSNGHGHARKTSASSLSSSSLPSSSSHSRIAQPKEGEESTGRTSPNGKSAASSSSSSSSAAAPEFDDANPMHWLPRRLSQTGVTPLKPSESAKALPRPKALLAVESLPSAPAGMVRAQTMHLARPGQLSGNQQSAEDQVWELTRLLQKSEAKYQQMKKSLSLEKRRQTMAQTKSRMQKVEATVHNLEYQIYYGDAPKDREISALKDQIRILHNQASNQSSASDEHKDSKALQESAAEVSSLKQKADDSQARIRQLESELSKSTSELLHTKQQLDTARTALESQQSSPHADSNNSSGHPRFHPSHPAMLKRKDTVVAGAAGFESSVHSSLNLSSSSSDSLTDAQPGENAESKSATSAQQQTTVQPASVSIDWDALRANVRSEMASVTQAVEKSVASVQQRMEASQGNVQRLQTFATGIIAALVLILAILLMK